MKKSLLFIIAILCVVLVNAQTVVRYDTPVEKGQTTVPRAKINDYDDNNKAESETKFYIEEGKLKVNNLPTGAKIELFNVVGSRALTTEYNGVSVPLNNINKGIYIVRSGKITQKIIY